MLSKGAVKGFAPVEPVVKKQADRGPGICCIQGCLQSVILQCICEKYLDGDYLVLHGRFRCLGFTPRNFYVTGLEWIDLFWADSPPPQSHICIHIPLGEGSHLIPLCIPSTNKVPKKKILLDDPSFKLCFK